MVNTPLHLYGKFRRLCKVTFPEIDEKLSFSLKKILIWIFQMGLQMIFGRLYLLLTNSFKSIVTYWPDAKQLLPDDATNLQMIRNWPCWFSDTKLQMTSTKGFEPTVVADVVENRETLEDVRREAVYKSAVIHWLNPKYTQAQCNAASYTYRGLSVKVGSSRQHKQTAIDYDNSSNTTLQCTKTSSHDRTTHSSISLVFQSNMLLII